MRRKGNKNSIIIYSNSNNSINREKLTTRVQVMTTKAVLFVGLTVATLVSGLAPPKPPITTQQGTIPRIIQGGMGIRISSWKLARQVALEGELGVVSATAIDTVFVRTLQSGDPDGSMRRALASFPDQDMASRLLDKYYIEGGKNVNKPFRSLPMWTLEPPQALLEATVAANYCEVWLAKHGDDGTPIGEHSPVGINRLTKVQTPTLASLYGAMLADVDYVIMGAGIPLQVPGILDDFAAGKEARFPVDVGNDQHFMSFDPRAFWEKAGRPEMAQQLRHLKRPKFVPIVSSVVLAQSFLKRGNGVGPTKGVDGFVIELPAAGGHNAPPRGFRYDPVAKSHAVDLNKRGEPVYGPKDAVDLAKFVKASKGLPFWLAGAYAHPDKFRDVLELGGAGVQVGTLFALAEESGMEDATRQEILSSLVQNKDKDLTVFTDPVASPTGYPFKVLELENTLSKAENYEERPRLCSLGYLRTPYIDDKTGKIGYRCPAEPVEDWIKKGGELEATVGRKCLCNALCANVGLPQTRAFVNKETGKKGRYEEGKLITIGDEVNRCRRFIQKLDDGRWGYSATDVVSYLKSEWLESKARQEIKDAVLSEWTRRQAAEARSEAVAEAISNTTLA